MSSSHSLIFQVPLVWARSVGKDEICHLLGFDFESRYGLCLVNEFMLIQIFWVSDCVN